ncbi:hypothetical protein CUMW_197970 [Citrus unshiu]|nr:hypothetical protein CUMW_197970 [Citrus unshiu]
MEKIRADSLLVMCFVFGLLFGQSAATSSWLECYRNCLEPCMMAHKSMLYCSFKCMKKCSFSVHTLRDTHFFCELGCVSSLCIDFSTKDNPAEDKVESNCLDSCSKTCTKNYK